MVPHFEDDMGRNRRIICIYNGAHYDIPLQLGWASHQRVSNVFVVSTLDATKPPLMKEQQIARTSILVCCLCMMMMTTMMMMPMTMMTTMMKIAEYAIQGRTRGGEDKHWGWRKTRRDSDKREKLVSNFFEVSGSMIAVDRNAMIVYSALFTEFLFESGSWIAVDRITVNGFQGTNHFWAAAPTGDEVR